MQRLMLATALLTLCSACGPKVVYKPLPVPPERMDCQAAGERPNLPAEDWTSVPAAKTATRAREAVIADYILSIERSLFACANDDQWLREYQAGVIEKTD